jgi:hypothetical protein
MDLLDAVAAGQGVQALPEKISIFTPPSPAWPGR